MSSSNLNMFPITPEPEVKKEREGSFFYIYLLIVKHLFYIVVSIFI